MQENKKKTLTEEKSLAIQSAVGSLSVLNG
jgi:hypothetical protein